MRTVASSLKPGPAHARSGNQPPIAAAGYLAGCAGSKRGLHGPLRDAVAHADEFEDGPRAGVAQPRLGQPQDAGVAAGAIGEPRGDLGEQDPHGLLVAQQHAARGGGPTTTGAIAWFHLLPLVALAPASSRPRCCARPWCRTCRPPAGPAGALRAIVMHRSTSGRTSLAFCERGDDAALDLGLVVVDLGVALGQEQARWPGCAARPADGWGAAERAAFSSMSHGQMSFVQWTLSTGSMRATGELHGVRRRRRPAPACPAAGPARSASRALR